jgi:predicted dehydrogenase
MGASPVPAAQAAAQKPRVLVVGAGYFAQFHLQGWIAAGATLAGLCDTDRGRAAALAERFDVKTVGTDAAGMMDQLQPDLVDIVLQPAAQSGVVGAALARGLHSVCQKPFGRDLADARAMVAAAQSAGRVKPVALIVHENFRFAPWFREARRMIDAGMFGRLYGVSFRLRPGDGQGAHAYLDRQPYFRSMPRLLVRETAVHFIDCFRYLCGDVIAVTARLRRLNPTIAGEDAGVILFEFEDDRIGLFDGNRLNDHAAADMRRTMGEMWLEGERGVLRLDGDARLWWKPHGQPEHEHRYAVDEAAFAGPFGGAVTALQAHVIAHLREGTRLENAAMDYLPNLYAQEAVYLSNQTGARVQIGRDGALRVATTTAAMG